MLRKGLLWFGVLLLLAGLLIGLASHSFAGLGPAGLGALLVVPILVERRGYKRIQDHAPGLDWQPTGERFLEPGSDVPVAVYFHPATGRRAYVRTGRP